MLRTFDRYLLREIVPPFFLGLLLFSFVLLMNQILILTEQIVTRGVSALTTLKLLGFLMPAILAFTVPMSVLVGVLGGLSRLSSDSEITAFKTLGIGRARLLRPLLLFALGGWALSSFLTLYLTPRSNALYVQTYIRQVLHRVQFRVAPRVFNESLNNTVIYFLDFDEQNDRWKNVLIFLRSDPNEPRLILAGKGSLNAAPDLKTLTLSLIEGEEHSHPQDAPEKYKLTFFRSLKEDLPVENLVDAFSHARTIREKDIRVLLREEQAIRRELKDMNERRREEVSPARWAVERDGKARESRSYGIEIHKRFALPLACLVFVFLGIPLGATTRKGGRTSGFTIGIGIIVLYYILITAGEQLARDGKLSPVLGMWGPNLLFFVLGLILFLRSDRKWEFRRRLPARENRPRAESAVARGAGRTEIPKTKTGPAFPRLLDRYVMRRWGFLFGLVFMGLLAMTVVVTFFERINTVYEHRKPVGLLLKFIWFTIPDYSNYIFPVAALAAMLLSLGILTKTNEVTAVKAGGISIYRLILPVGFLALTVSLFSFYLQERVLPHSNKKANRIWDEINDLPSRSYNPLERTWLVNRAKDRFFHYAYFDPRANAFRQLTVLDVDPDEWRIRRRLFAEHAVLNGSSLELSQGWMRRFERDAPTPFERFDRSALSLEETREFFLKEWKEPSQMTLGELRSYIREVKDLGFDTNRLEVDRQTKIALPLVAVVMTLIGIPFAFAMGKRGALVGIGVAVAIAMLYWGALGFFRGLGYAGTLPPFLAAWAPNILFGLGGVYGLLTLRT